MHTFPTGEKNPLSKLNQTKLAAVVLLLPAVLLWLPFGWRTTGTVEEWLSLEGWFYGKPVVDFLAPRPLHTAPNWIAYTLTPYSFLGLNVMMMLAIWAEGLALFLLLRRIGYGAALSMAAAALLMLHPSDGAAMALRLTAHHIAIACFLLGVWILFGDGHKLWNMTFMLACLGVSLLIYEAAFPLAFLAPLLRAKSRKSSRKIIVWFSATTILFVHYLWAFLKPDSPQASMLDFSLIGGLLATIRVYILTLFWDWLRAFGRFDNGLYLFLALICAITFGIFLWKLHVDRDQDTALLAVIGLVAIGAGFLMFTQSDARFAKWRIFLYPSIGASITIAAVVRRYAGILAPFILSFLILLGMNSALHQHEYYVEVSNTQQSIIAGAANALACSPDVNTVVLFDETGTLIPDVLPNSRRVRIALEVIFDDPDLMFMICYPDGNHATLFYEECNVSSDEVVLRYSERYRAESPDTLFTTPSNNAVVLRYDGERVLPDKHCELPSRAYRLLPILQR